MYFILYAFCFLSRKKNWFQLTITKITELVYLTLQNATNFIPAKLSLCLTYKITIC